MLSKQQSQPQLETSPLAYQHPATFLEDYIQSEPIYDNTITTNATSITTTKITTTRTTTVTPIDRCSPAESYCKMQTSSVRSLVSGDHSSTVDLTTDNLPAVDTPDACDKAALR